MNFNEKLAFYNNIKVSDNKGIRLIKQFVFKIYKLMKETSIEVEKDA